MPRQAMGVYSGIRFIPEAISIHAPLARCDLFSKVTLLILPNFNPRTSCEVRRGRLPCCWRYEYFNPRTSCEVRPRVMMYFPSYFPFPTPPVFQERCKAYISIHAPLARCDGQPVRRSLPYPHHFNPRTSCEVRLYHVRYVPVQHIISIHAPLARCDLARRALFCMLCAFQSTHLLRGATGSGRLAT